MESITACLHALQALLDVPWPRSKIGSDQVISRFFVWLLYISRNRNRNMSRLLQWIGSKHGEVKRKLKNCTARPQNWNGISNCAEPGAVMPLSATFCLCFCRAYFCCHQPTTPCSSSSCELSAMMGRFYIILSLSLSASVHPALRIYLYLIPRFPERVSSWFT